MKEVGVAGNPDCSKRFRVRRLLGQQCFAFIVLVLILACPASGTDSVSAKNVLVLYSFTDRSLFESPDSFESALRSPVPGVVNFNVEYLESRRFDNADYEKNLAGALGNTYRETKLDLVIADAIPALWFALKHRNELFPGVPIVFFEIDGRRIEGQKMRPGVTGVTLTWNVGGTIDLALRLHPEQARRVLSGEQVESIPVMHDTSERVTVDWRALRRWHIPESALPPGGLVLYREPTLWERERKYIIPAIVVIIAQVVWIVALLWQRDRKRRADAALEESERRFQRMANTTPSLVWMSDQQGKVTYLNDRRIEFTGRNPEAGYDDVWTNYIHPDDVEAVLSTNALGLERRENFSKQYRLRRKDGVYRWMFDVAAPRINGDGSLAGFIGSAADITDQILAQEALEKVSGQLIEAQERERSRIARDLHDDICQRLALVSMDLEQANRNGLPRATKEHLEKIRQQCSEITGDIQSVSHELHSSKLEYLGLVAAMRGMCRELSKKHEVSIEFAGHNVPRLPSDISLCLFRVAQEALHNGLKYSRSSQFSVELSATANEIRLEVKDAGLGFDVEKAKRNGGLGLVSMQERVHLVRGKLHVESAPGRGTKITAVVPVIHQIAADLVDGTDSEPASMSGAA